MFLTIYHLLFNFMNLTNTTGMSHIKVVWHVSYYKCPDDRRCFISIASQLYFRKYCWEESSQHGKVETDWYSSPSGLG